MVCRKVKNVNIEQTQAVHLFSEWINATVAPFGKSKAAKLLSLRKKMGKHRQSLGHKAAIRILKTSEKKILEECTSQQHKNQYIKTEKNIPNCLLSSKTRASFH